MKKLNKSIIILSIFPFVINTISIFILPTKVPIHFNFIGQVTRFGSKYELFILPIALICLILFIFFISFKNIPEDDYQKNKQNIYISLLIISITFNLLNICFLLAAFSLTEKYNINLNVIFSILIGITFIMLGNMIPKCKKNSYIGIKTKKTLNNFII